MSEPQYDAAGREWTFQGWAEHRPKTWSTRDTFTNEPIELVASEGEGWVLRRINQSDIPTNHTSMNRALEAIQPILSGGTKLRLWVPTTEEVRKDYSVRDPKVYEAAFDRWLAAHDAELIETLTSVAKVMEPS